MKKILSHNITINFIVRIISYLFSFLTVIYITRIFSPNIYGKISFSNSIIYYFLMISCIGMPIYAMRMCAQYKNDRKELSKIFNELFSINIVLSIFSILLLFVMILLVPKFQKNMIILLLYGIGIILQTIGCEWLYKGLEKFKFLAVNYIVFNAISFICLLLFVHKTGDVYVYIILSLIANYGYDFVLFFKLKKYVDFSYKIKINKDHFKPLVIFSLMSCAVSIYSQLDIVVLGFFKGDRVTGLYALVSKIKTVLTITGAVFWSTNLPKATALWNDKKEDKFRRLIKKSLGIVFLIQLFVTIGFFIFAKEVLYIVGGKKYVDAVLAFRLLLLSLVPIGMSNILGGQVLVPTNCEKKLMKAEFFGAIFNLIANIIVVPYFSMEGAAVTTVISEIIVLLLCLYYIKKELGINLAFVITKKVYYYLMRCITLLKVCVESKFRSNYYCPCCNKKMNHFYDGKYNKKSSIYSLDRYKNIDQKVICPVCGSLPRHRIIVSWMNDHINEFRNKKVLHFAQEESIRRWLKRNNISYTTADIKGDVDLLIDIEDTKLKSKSIDIIICNHVLEHVNDYNKALDELKRILSDNGFIIISFPVDSKYDEVCENKDEKDRLKVFGQIDHLRIFGKNTDKMFIKKGFKVEKIIGDNYDEKIKPVIGPADYDSNIIYVLKKL